MDVNQMTFGLEIEATIPRGLFAVGGHNRGLPIAVLPGWLADADPSIHAGRGREACEFVSPVFKGPEGLSQLIADLAKIKALGAKVNTTCGLHVHVGFDRTNTVACEKLASLIANFEKAIFASTGTRNRERGRWCQGISIHGNPRNAIRRSQVDRYHVANFGTVHPTVEFRAFSGSLNPAKIVAYVRMSLGLVERALSMKRFTPWSAKPVKETSPIHRSGEGQTALTRLYYQLGWVKGRQSHVFGNLQANNAGTLRRSRKTLMELARKYDAER